jgi:hypothetical protein
MGSAFLYLLIFRFIVKKHKNATFVRFSDYYLNVPPWDHSFLIPLYRDSYVLNYLLSAYPSDI